MANAPFITLNNITVRLRDRWLLQGTQWQIRRGEQWVIWGANGAGKTTLARTLMGHMPVVQGEVLRHYLEDPAVCAGRGSMALVSAEQSHQLYEQERWLAEMRHFSGRLQETTRAGALLLPASGAAPAQAFTEQHRRLLRAFDLGALLAKPLEALSSGEMRKVLLARALLHDPCLLILDEPFNGLDAASQTQLGQILQQLVLAGRQMVLITHRLAEISDYFTHVLQLEEGRVAWQGEKQAFFQRIARTETGPPIEGRDAKGALIPTGVAAGTPLIEMRNVTVRFGDQLVLDRVNWTIHPGENWALVGPNGAGKSTLLALITGDQLQAYANEIKLFGRPKGSGESLWEIKQYIGQVGDTLQARYQRRVTAFDVICSGFFDSVGLYRRCDEAQRRTARQWVERLSLADLAGRPMSQLSFGQQRLIIIARAVVKTPRLLILDEPCNGLDDMHRRRVLAILDLIGRTGATNLLYVSHRSDDMPECITHRLHLEAGRVTGCWRDAYGPEGGPRRKIWPSE